MAKKKNQSHHSRTEKEENLHPNRQQPPAMTDQPQQLPPPRTSSLEADREFQKLKSLNALLVKDVADKRRQVETLQKEKKDLAAELEEFESASDDSISSEIERDVAFAALAEMRKNQEEIRRLSADFEAGKERLSKICREKDLIASELDDKVLEADGLRARVKELEEKETENGAEIRRLAADVERLVSQKKDVEKEVERLERAQDSVGKSLGEKVEEIGALKVGIDRIVAEKKGIEKEKSDQVVKIGFLEKDVEELRSDLFSSRSENEGLKGKVVDLEKSYRDAIEKEKAVGEMVQNFMEEQRENNELIERLKEEKSSLEKTIESVDVEMQGKNERIQKLSIEVSQIEAMTRRKESEIVELQNNVSELSKSLAALQESLKAQEDKNMELAHESIQYKDYLDKIKFQKEELMKLLVEEKSQRSKLSAKLAEMEKRTKEVMEMLEKAKSEEEKLMEAKKSMEAEIGLLKEESCVTQKRLFDAELENGDLTAKLESSKAKLERALRLLDYTVELVPENSKGSELEHQVEAVKNCFRDKDALLKKTNQEVASLQESVADAEKRKNIWAMVSSVAAMFAAASLAFALKVR